MRKTLGLVVMLFLAASPLFATQARLNGLGIAAWMIEEDDNLIFFNPSRIRNYPKLIWGELGTDVAAGAFIISKNNVALANQWGGVSGHSPLIEGSVLGLFLNRPYGGIVGTAGAAAAGSDVTAIPANPNGNAMTALAPQTRFDFFYAFPLSDMTLGARLTSAGNYAKTETSNVVPALTGSTQASDERSSSDTNLVLGSRMGDVLLFSDLDLVLTLGFVGAKNTYKAAAYGTSWVTTNDWKLETKAPVNLGFTLRGAIPTAGNNSLFAYFNYAANDVSNTFAQMIDANGDGAFTTVGVDTNAEQERAQKQSLLTIGAAYNAKTNQRTMLIVAANLNSVTATNNASRQQLFSAQGGKDQEYNSETATLNIPVNIALEHRFSPVVATRIGVAQNLYQLTTTKVNDPDYAWNGTAYAQTSVIETKTSTQVLGATTLSLGGGFTLFKGLTLDAVVRQQVLFTGTYLISGVPETLVSQLSAIYKF